MKNTFLRKPFRYSFNNAALIIIAINIGVFMLTSMNPTLKTYLSLNVFLVLEKHMYFEFFTYMFTHANFYHLLGNMLGVLFFGTSVERAIGSKEFVLMYLLIGLLCGVVSFAVYFFSGMYLTFLLGASGSVYAILLMYAVIY
ncbi:MAG: rhomboid family intramembrane serine protease, partial [Spirochaetales bacterium]